MVNKAFANKNVDGCSVVSKFEAFSAEQWSQNLGYQIAHQDDFKAFKQNAKLVVIGSKGKATFAAVKKWVKENNPKEYFAKWRCDSPLHKDDCVDIYVIK